MVRWSKKRKNCLGHIAQKMKKDESRYVHEKYSGMNGTGSLPILTNTGINITDVEAQAHSACLASFTPFMSTKQANFVMTVSGTTYYLCCWYYHFSHILLNMVFSTFHALVKLGLKDELSSMKYLITDRGCADHEQYFQNF